MEVIRFRSYWHFRDHIMVAEKPRLLTFYKSIDSNYSSLDRQETKYYSLQGNKNKSRATENKAMLSLLLL